MTERIAGVALCVLELREGAPAGGQGEAPAPGMTEPEAPAPRFSGAF